MHTQKDVAKRAGVSQAIVSYVLNGSNYVGKKKREAVLKAIEELDYHPNYTAKSLRTKKTRNLVVLTWDVRTELYSDIIYYLELLAYERGYFIFVTSISTREKALDYFGTLMSQKYDGIFLTTNIYNEGQLSKLANTGIPIVLFQHTEFEALDPAVSVLRPPIYQYSRMAVDYLIEQKKHSRIGYLTFGNPVDAGEPGPYGRGYRINGYLDSMRSHNLQIIHEWVVHLDAQEESEDLSESIKGVAQRYLSTPTEERPTAFFTGLDTIAAALITEMNAIGVRIPEELEVIGFGNSFSSRICNPTLTTIDLDCKLAAQHMLEMLINMSEGEPSELRTMPLQLILRGSA